MTREARLNFIFLAIMIVAMIPGGVILIKKKLEPGARSNAEPEVFRKETAYMDPLSLPHFTRVVPPLTVQWVEQITLSKMIVPPIMSERRTYQVVSEERDDASATVGKIIVWNLKALGGRDIELMVGGHHVDVSSVKMIDVPKNIREELQTSGFINPPHQVEVASFEIKQNDGNRLELNGEPCGVLVSQQH